jgi:hypothetical protein
MDFEIDMVRGEEHRRFLASSDSDEAAVEEFTVDGGTVLEWSKKNPGWNLATVRMIPKIEVESSISLTIGRGRYSVEYCPTGITLNGPNGSYAVSWDGSCNCQDSTYRGRVCKHRYAVGRLLRSLEKRVLP